jgi:LmbE family N-acetylglucosaminyl deacetylase
MFFFDQAPRVLCIGAHPDDIELGAGGFVHRLVRKLQAKVDLLVITEGRQGLGRGKLYDPSVRRAQAEDAAEVLAVRREHVHVLTYPDCRLHEHEHEIIRTLEETVFDADGGARYDVILTHAGEDTHADHRIVHETTLAAVREFHGTVLLYQSPSTKPNGFRPTFFVQLDHEDIERKHEAIRAHESQRHRSYNQKGRIRGMAINWSVFLRLPDDVYLEAFEVYKSFYRNGAAAHSKESVPPITAQR